LAFIVGEALHLFGTPEQKERWLRPLLAGKLIAAEVPVQAAPTYLRRP